MDNLHDWRECLNIKTLVYISLWFLFVLSVGIGTSSANDGHHSSWIFITSKRYFWFWMCLYLLMLVTSAATVSYMVFAVCSTRAAVWSSQPVHSCKRTSTTCGEARREVEHYYYYCVLLGHGWCSFPSASPCLSFLRILILQFPLPSPSLPPFTLPPSYPSLPPLSLPTFTPLASPSLPPPPLPPPPPLLLLSLSQSWGGNKEAGEKGECLNWGECTCKGFGWLPDRE